jgi:hypothetical protein
MKGTGKLSTAQLNQKLGGCMMNRQAFSFSGCDITEPRVYCLSKNIAGIQVLPAVGVGEPRLGMITQLPQGAELELCGEGFNDRTIRVRWAEGFYFVFLQDLEIQRTKSASI